MIGGEEAAAGKKTPESSSADEKELERASRNASHPHRRPYRIPEATGRPAILRVGSHPPRIAFCSGDVESSAQKQKRSPPHLPPRPMQTLSSKHIIDALAHKRTHSCSVSHFAYRGALAHVKREIPAYRARASASYMAHHSACV